MIVTAIAAGIDQVRLKNADASKLPIEHETLDFACRLQVYCYIKELDEALMTFAGASNPVAARSSWILIFRVWFGRTEIAIVCARSCVRSMSMRMARPSADCQAG
ncbi:hypothetical protein SAMN04488498_115121 [Mesorhizobium albiziae]|uniref:Uncharacterized protein n=1 Tax=Neomesorhizobium albiziae TaxID=335020 RepID=A0A1I4D6D6_9HYPH|nr:hypothetical protein GCM10007937_00190 [Mesorhizobium albiziae]SFK87541.1 hypothetical protein SAMN04488498_115121 [Mesorhizobium albiziae]